MVIVLNNTDLFLAPGVDYIAHQVNCQGVMGAGLANTIRVVNPPVYELYKQHCKNYKPSELLGKSFICNRIISVFGQLNYGRDPNVVYTDYNALRKAFTAIHNRLPIDKNIAFPYGFGCGLAHGNWDIVLKLIVECFQGRTIIICRRDSGDSKPILVDKHHECIWKAYADRKDTTEYTFDRPITEVEFRAYLKSIGVEVLGAHENWWEKYGVISGSGKTWTYTEVEPNTD